MIQVYNPTLKIQELKKLKENNMIESTELIDIKGMSFKITPQIYLDDIAFNINSMPRKMFGFKSSYEIEMEY